MSSRRLPKPKIVVVGGGIVGLTTAHTLLDYYSSQLESVTLISEEWSPNTTGDVSAGLVYPYLVGKQTDARLLETLFAHSMTQLRELWRTPNAGQVGLSLATIYELHRDEADRKAHEISDAMAKQLPLYQDMSESELAWFQPSGTTSPQWTSGKTFTTFMLEPALFLPHLKEQFIAMGGKMKTEYVKELRPLLAQYDRVINCTGLGSRYLEDVQDMEVVPVRGQVLRVHAPWVRHGIMAGQAYILPNNEELILGGTSDHMQLNLHPDEEVSQRILRDCVQLLPSLVSAPIKSVQCGLRPYREAIRIEIDPAEPYIIHNYGHGGSGVTLALGSARKIVELIYDSLLK